jgi:limonene-1,2-epoxide hydrolase
MSDTTTDPVEIVREFMALMAKLDYDRALTLVSADCEYINMPIGAVTGPEGIRSVLEPFFAPTIENEWVIKNVAAAGPVVFMERLDRHHLPKGWTELPVTGVFEVHDGLITKWRDYFDFATIERGIAANV